MRIATTATKTSIGPQDPAIAAPFTSLGSIRDRPWVLALALVFWLAAALGGSDAASAAKVTEFRAVFGEYSSAMIAAGPDGNLWFTDGRRDRVGRITPEGKVTEFKDGIGGGTESGPEGIAAGPDGNLWFTEPYGRTPYETGLTKPGRVGRITPAGKVTEFSAGISDAPEGIAAGPDGNLWFTEGSGKIGRITPAGKVTEFITAGLSTTGITAGPDGNLWFTEADDGKIGRITPAGKVTEFSGVGRDSRPTGITAGPDGNLWFTTRQRIGRITPAGKVTKFSAGITAHPEGIAAGPDGNLWFTEYFGRLGRITPAGKVTEFSAGITAHPAGIAAGPDGNLWFTEPYGHRVGRITPTGGPMVTIRTRRARVSARGVTSLDLACGKHAGRCTGNLVLTGSVTLARARYSVRAGQHARVKLALRRTALKRLAQAEHHRIFTRARAIGSGGDAVGRVTLIGSRRAGGGVR